MTLKEAQSHNEVQSPQALHSSCVQFSIVGLILKAGFIMIL